MLDFSFFAVRQFDLYLFDFLRLARFSYVSRLSLVLLLDGCFRFAWFRFYRFAVPFRVGKVMIGVHKIIDGEIFFAVKQPGSSPDDLLELNHGIDRPHQDNIADVAGIHSGGELLRSGQDWSE